MTLIHEKHWVTNCHPLISLSSFFILSILFWNRKLALQHIRTSKQLVCTLRAQPEGKDGCITCAGPDHFGVG